MSEKKATVAENPKDIIGKTKLPLGVVPDSMVVYASLGFVEGALKYGRYNWRVLGVSASIYHDAAKRHLAKWWNGEETDPVTGVPHLASAMDCLAIILDANLCGKLQDDRPPSAPVSSLIEDSMENVAYLRDLFKDHNPHQYTIKDSV